MLFCKKHSSTSIQQYTLLPFKTSITIEKLLGLSNLPWLQDFAYFQTPIGACNHDLFVTTKCALKISKQVSKHNKKFEEAKFHEQIGAKILRVVHEQNFKSTHSQKFKNK
jgi:hypothetical protein